ncbi:MAG TPA: hypothetical protein VGM75_02890 [Pseudonocardiaceae bacterium]
MKRGTSPWTPEIPTRQPERRQWRERRISPTILALIAGGTAFVAVIAVVVFVGVNHRNVEAGTPIAVATTQTLPTSDNPGQPSTATEQPTTQPLTQGAEPGGYVPASGPAGVTVNIPSGWTVSQPFAAEDEADDPSGSGSLIRYGGTPSSSASLLDVVSGDEASNTSVKTGYQQLQLGQVQSATGDDTVVWEFLFDKAGVQRHVLSWFWRAQGYDYLVYFSTTEANWPSMQPVVNLVEQTAGPT